MPHLGINAIESMRLLLNELVDYRVAFAAHPQLGKSSMSVNTICGGKATNVICDECSITVDIRTLPGQSHGGIVAGFEELLARLSAAHSQFAAEVAVVRDCPALETDAQSGFVKAVCQVRGVEKPGKVGFTTDGPIFAALGAPVIIFGPGKSEACHQPDEYIEIAEVEKAKQYYKDAILNLQA
jgi:succinyl-diaminopimelate desuccinylase